MMEIVAYVVCGVIFYCLGYRTGKRDTRDGIWEASEIEAELNRQKRLREWRAESEERGRVPEDA